MKIVTVVIFIFLTFASCKKESKPNLKNTIFKLGFQTSTSSTGPLGNSGFVMKLNDTIPPLFVTAHHVVAFTKIANEYLKWFEIKEKVRDARIWSMQDSTYQIQLSDNIPILNAETLKLDLAAFYLPSVDTPYLIPSANDATIGDTVQLFSKIVYNGNTSFTNEGVVVYRTDSAMVYELLNFHMARIMAGTSGSAILNKEGQVVANSYAGFTIPNQQVKSGMEKMFPLLKKIPTRDGKTYGAGVPISLITISLLQATSIQGK
jgi:hypothetical protein